jgi:hypothetical protein
VLATSFGVFALLPTALLLPAFQNLQLYADLPYCPDDRALRRHIHLIPPHYKASVSKAIAFKHEHPDEKSTTAARIYQVNDNTIRTNLRREQIRGGRPQQDAFGHAD